MKRVIITVIAFLLLLACTPGCVEDSGASPNYSISDEGLLQVTEIPLEWTSEEIEKRGTVTLSEVIFTGNEGDVYGLLAAPEMPVAGIVLIPGAGVVKEEHLNRSLAYAKEGIATLVLDPRGNGGETKGRAASLTKDYSEWRRGEVPQYWRIAGDAIAARMMLSERSNVPVYIMGSSLGGMYAAVAAAADPGAAGYIGVSTSQLPAMDADENPQYVMFLRTLDAGAAVPVISPKPVWILHGTRDPVIPFSDGIALSNMAGEPKEFFGFNGTHGLNNEADLLVTDAILTFKGV